MDAGELFLCPFCGRAIHPGRPWDIDHRIPLDVDPRGLWDRANMRPAHARCNRAAGARLVNAKRGQQRHRRRLAATLVRCAGCGDLAECWLCDRCAAVVEAG